jgi:uncharacterized protein YuzE
MAVYTYDADADVLYVLLGEESEAAVSRTDEVGPNLHVDFDAEGRMVGIEFLYARARGLDATPISERYGIELAIPFTFAA